MALLKNYFELTDKYVAEKGEKTILLMQVGAFFEVYGKKDKHGNIHGSNIVEYCSFCELSQAYKSPGHIMAGFRDYMLEKYLKKIQDNGYTAVVYVQDTPSTNTTRSLLGIYSPGTYFSYDSNDITNNISCIWIQENKSIITKTTNIILGMSNIDIYTGRSNIFETVVENIHNPTTYDELERYLSSYNPSELMLISNLQNDKIEDILNFVNNKSKKTHIVNLNNKEDENVKKAYNCEKQIYIHEVLNKFFSFSIEKSLLDQLSDSVYGCQSFIYLLDFIYEHNPNLIYKIKEPEFENIFNRMILANHSLKQLNIIEDNNYSGKYSCVLRFLNNCITPMGIRRFKYKLLHPIFDKEKLRNKYDMTEYLLDNKELYEYWRKELQEIKDIEKLNRQIILKKINPQSLFILYNNLSKIKTIYNKNKKDKYLIEKIIKYKEVVSYCDEIKNLIDKYFVIEECKNIDNLNFDKNFIKENVNKSLDECVDLYNTSKIKLEIVRKFLDNLIGEKEKNKKNKSDFVKIHETDKMGYSLITTKRRGLILKSEIEKLKKEEIILEIDSNKSFTFNLKLETYNSTASNVTINNLEINQTCKDIITSKNKMKDEISLVYYEFIDKLKEMNNQFNLIIDYITLLDLLQNQCYIADKYTYCKPIICEGDKSFVKVEKLRHCLIEHLNKNEIYVTNDIELGKDINGTLLYGTNAVGKTSFIRSIGICIIMAQAGLYVPCSSFNYVPYKSLFTRILGNDNIFKGLSTFGVEMSELRVILKMSDKNSLILGDELCSGTEYDSALSIFVSGLNELHKKESSFIFATHLHEIVEYDEIKALTKLNMKHMVVRYDREKDILIYDRILRDGCGESMYGLEVCESLHMPDEFLQNAKQIRKKYLKKEGALSLKTSHYNNSKIKGLCELCNKNTGEEVHHLMHQKNAINNKFDHIHKNHIGNLLTVCKLCHDKIHIDNKQHKKVKTNKGFIIEEI